MIPPDQADNADTYTREEYGRWAVYVAVTFNDGVVTHRITDYNNPTLAARAAAWIKAAANRTDMRFR